MVDYLGGECQIPSCRYSKHLRNLTFHHVDPETKAFNIAGSHCRSWKTLQAELDKCVLLCIRCHVEVEDGLIEIPAAVLEPVLAHVATLPKTRIAPKRASALV